MPQVPESLCQTRRKCDVFRAENVLFVAVRRWARWLVWRPWRFLQWVPRLVRWARARLVRRPWPRRTRRLPRRTRRQHHDDRRQEAHARTHSGGQVSGITDFSCACFCHLQLEVQSEGAITFSDPLQKGAGPPNAFNKRDYVLVRPQFEEGMSFAKSGGGGLLYMIFWNELSVSVVMQRVNVYFVLDCLSVHLASWFCLKHYHASLTYEWLRQGGDVSRWCRAAHLVFR